MGTYLVTGAAGFLGAHIIQSLVDAGHRVRALDVLPQSNSLPSVECVQADVCDAPAMAQAMAGIDVVIHNAALVPVTDAGDRFWVVNVEGTRTVLQAALDAGVEKVVHVSSSSVFGKVDQCPILEDAPKKPFEQYGQSKLAAEGVCTEYRDHGLDVVILRPRTIIGEGRLGILELLFDRVQRGKWFPLLGRGNNRFQLVSARDMANAIRVAGEHPCRNMDFNVGGKAFDTLRNDLQNFMKAAGSRSKVRGIPKWLLLPALWVLALLRLSPIQSLHYHMVSNDYYFSTDRIERVLNWHAQDSNVDALLQAYSTFIAPKTGNDAPTGDSAHTGSLKRSFLGWVMRHV